jgi:hypothetical protein
VEVAFAPLVTNSAFTFGYSLSEPVFTPRVYMSAEELDQRMPLRYELVRDSADHPRNVVLLIVESLGREYLSAISGEKAYMPFLDSLWEVVKRLCERQPATRACARCWPHPCGGCLHEHHLRRQPGGRAGHA